MNKHPTITAGESQNRIHDVIQAVVRRRISGEVLTDDAVLLEFPELADVLPGELAKLRRIQDAAIRADAIPNSETNIASHSSTPDTRGHLRIRCPHCREPFEMPSDTPISDLVCEICGGQFSLIDSSDETRNAAVLKELAHFNLIERLGMGGFGTVWKGYDKELDRTVAVKLPRYGCMTIQDVEKFVREARAAAQLRHPNIVSVHEVGRDGDSLFIISDYVQGVSLSDWLSAQKPTARQAAEMCLSIAEALHHAHEHGVIHRDLKPANVLVDRNWQPHLTDFGLARREFGETTMTMDGQVLGTPAYMSPEQAQGEGHTADRRSDVYSLGVILFQLLTGELPFRGNARMLMHQVINDEPPSPRKLNSNIARDLEIITLKCLEKEPSRRYLTAQELSKELGRFVAGETIQSRPVGHLERGWRWCNRNPVVASLVAATAVSVIAVVTGTVMYALHQQEYALQQQQLVDDRTKLARNKEEARLDAETKLYHALLGRASASRTARAPGYRADVWKYLHEAAALDIPERNIDDIRDEVLACLGDPIGLDPIKSPSAPRLATVVPKHFEPIVAMQPRDAPQAVSADGQWLATSNHGGSDHRLTVQLWAANGLLAAEIESPLGGDHDLKFSADGQLLVLGCEQGIAVCSVPDLGRWMTIQGNSIRRVATQPHGSLFATMTISGRVELWSLASNRLITSLKVPTSNGTIEFSEDGKLLLGISSTGSNVNFGWVVGDSPEKIHLRGHAAGIPSVDFSPNGDILATVSKDRTVRLWDVVTGELRQTFRGHASDIEEVKFSPNGQLLVTGDWAGEIRVWDPLTGIELTRARHPGLIWRLGFDLSGQLLVTGGEFGAVCWQVRTSDSRVELIPFAEIPMHQIYDLAVHPGGLGFVAVRRMQPQWLTYWYDLTRTNEPEVLDLPIHGQANVICFDGTGTSLRFVTKTRAIGTADLAERRMVHVSSSGSPPYSRLAVTDDDAWAAIQGLTTITIYDVQNSRPLYSLPAEASDIWNLQWSPDGTRLAVAISDGVAAIWNLEEVRARLAEFGVDVPSTRRKAGKNKEIPILTQHQFEQIVETQRVRGEITRATSQR